MMNNIPKCSGIAIGSLCMPIYVELRENCAFILRRAARINDKTFMCKTCVYEDIADNLLQKI